MQRPIAVGIFAVTSILWHAASIAQAWPTKPIRILTSAPAGPYDIALRGLTPTLGQSLGQAVVVENRTGGNYVPLGEACVRANPDGYTLCTADVYTTVLNTHAFAKAPYAVKDFLPIIHFGYLYSALILHPSVPANSLAELLALAKAKPESIAFGTPGPATNSAMYVDYWKKNQGIAFLNVPYKAFTQALNAVVAGEIQVSLYGLGQAMNQVRAGKVKAVAITGEQRSRFAPNLPTFLEAGIDLTIANWGGFAAPLGTPRDVIMRLNNDIKKVITDPVLKEKFLDGQGFDQASPSAGTPEEFGAFLAKEDAKFARIVKITGLRLD
ncbi:MAG: Bug family tripartite tricarboxylate transporter substrate binding protein [Burkholderiales bacterium]